MCEISEKGRSRAGHVERPLLGSWLDAHSFRKDGLNFKDDSPTFVCHQSSLVCLSSFVKILRFPLFTINFQIENFAIRIENLIVLFKYSMKPFHRRMANLSGIDPTENGSKSAVREHLWLKYRTLQKLL